MALAADILPNGISVGATGTEGERLALLSLFRSVAEEEGWSPGDDLAGEAETSACVAVSVDGRLAGGALLRWPDAEGSLPMRSTWPELHGPALERPAELVLLAILPENRATPGLLWALCAEAWRCCAHAGVTDMFAAVPPRNLRIYRRLGWRPEPVGPERHHWGEPCLPCRIGMAEVAGEFERRAERSPGHALAVRVARRD